MVTRDEYIAAVSSNTRDIRAYLIGGRELDVTAPTDVESVAELSNVDEALTDWDALIDGRTHGGAVVSTEGASSMTVRITFGDVHGGPVTLHTSDNVKAVTVTWRDSAGEAVDTITREIFDDAGSGTWEASTDVGPLGPIMDVTIATDIAGGRLELRELVFGKGRPISQGVISIAWGESRNDVLDKWDVNDLTVRMSVGMDEGAPVERGDRLFLAMDVACPSGRVRVPCGSWLVDRVRRSGSELTIDAYDMRIRLNEVMDADLIEERPWTLADLMSKLDIPFKHEDALPVPIQDSDVDDVATEGGTYADLVYRTMLRRGLILYVRDDGTVSTSSMPDSDTPQDGLEPPMSWTITGAQALERVDETESDLCGTINILWPGHRGTSINTSLDGTITLILPVPPLAMVVPKRMRGLRHILRWTGDPQFWGMDTGSSTAFTMEGIPGVASDGYDHHADRIEHVFDGGYRQEVRFIAIPRG